MKALGQVLAASILLVCLSDAHAGAPTAAETEAAMIKATRFMVEEVAVGGGYVWWYLPDFSRRWGEMEAKPSMIWTQAPGTPDMGQIFLDAYHATGKEYFYTAASKAAEALIRGQHETGGWNYVIDFAGEDSLREWYDTIGGNGWRLEEFQHYYGNATFDDHVTAGCSRFLLRISLEKNDPRYRAALDKAIAFVLASQYPSGGWPQRYPPMGAWEKQGHPDYTGYVTLNDDVEAQNIDLLLLVLQQLGDAGVREPLRRAMDLYPRLQQAQPTPGWALQYTADLVAAGARTYEPRAVSPHTTADAVSKLMDFYELTGKRGFLEGIPAAIDWLERVEVPAELRSANGNNQFRYVEIGSNRYLAVHRRGSNAQNGEYYVDYDMSDQLPAKRVDTAALRQRYGRLSAMTPEAATAASAWFGRGPTLLPRYVVAAPGAASADLAPRVEALLDSLNEQGYWPAPLPMISHPWRGPGPAEPPPGFSDHRYVGDDWDTSPFPPESAPTGIVTQVYIDNMSLLIEYLLALKGESE